MKTVPSGIRVGQMRIPLGVVAVIYESRPNVTIDAAALALKSRNAIILRGGVYRTGDLQVFRQQTFDLDTPFYAAVKEEWQNALRRALVNLPRFDWE